MEKVEEWSQSQSAYGAVVAIKTNRFRQLAVFNSFPPTRLFHFLLTTRDYPMPKL